MTTTITDSRTADAEVELEFRRETIPVLRHWQFQEAIKRHLMMLEQLRSRILHATPEQLEWLRETALEISGHHLAHVEAARTSRLQAAALLAVCREDDEAAKDLPQEEPG
jgi:hypothetical protein